MGKRNKKPRLREDGHSIVPRALGGDGKEDADDDGAFHDAGSKVLREGTVKLHACLECILGSGLLKSLLNNS